ncbi:MAG TPA: DUF2490 domain-containing protein [Chryseolinea sp.]|nr:DUF2490 domain-containing protein [Chryseolinea sp.]
MVKSSLFLIAIFTVSLQTLFAQQDEKQVVNQAIQWFSVNSNIALTKRFSLYIEGQFRQVGTFDPMQYQLRTAVDVKLNDHFSIVPVGYVYTWNYQYGKQPAAYKNNEHRFFQQVVYKHSLGITKIDHRIRIEERFVQHHHTNTDGEIVDDGYDVELYRLRYRLMARVPLNAKKIEPGTWFLSAYDEVFVSWGSPVTYHKPDQNRLFAGIGFQFDKSTTLQGGLLYHMLIKGNGTMQENNVGPQVMLTYNLDCSKAH